MLARQTIIFTHQSIWSLWCGITKRIFQWWRLYIVWQNCFPEILLHSTHVYSYISDQKDWSISYVLRSLTLPFSVCRFTLCWCAKGVLRRTGTSCCGGQSAFLLKGGIILRWVSGPGGPMSSFVGFCFIYAWPYSDSVSLTLPLYLWLSVSESLCLAVTLCFWLCL